MQLPDHTLPLITFFGFLKTESNEKENLERIIKHLFLYIHIYSLTEFICSREIILKLGTLFMGSIVINLLQINTLLVWQLCTGLTCKWPTSDCMKK